MGFSTKWLGRGRAGVAATCFLAGVASAADEITVGATIPITGNFAASGIQYYNALKMAEDDINAQGGIHGKKLRIVYEDTAANNSTAVNAFVKLVQQRSPSFVFLSSLSTQVLAMEPAVAKAKVAAMYGGGAAAVQDRKNPWMFRVRPSDSVQAGAIAYAVTDVLKKKKPAILFAQDDYGLGAANTVEGLLAKAGLTLVAKEAFNPRDNDFSAQLLSLKAKGADVVVTFAYNRDGALILKQRKSLGLDMPFVGGSAFVAPSTLGLVDAGDLSGVYGVSDAILGASVSPASADFVRRYTASFKMAPDSFGAAYYDGALILADGLRKVGPDAEKLRDYLSHLKDVQGIARRYTTDATTGNMAHGVVLVQFPPGSKDAVAVSPFPRP